MGRQIEGFPTVVKKDHRIYCTMHNQESDQEQSGYSHHQFTANGRSKKRIKPTHAYVFIAIANVKQQCLNSYIIAV